MAQAGLRGFLSSSSGGSSNGVGGLGSLAWGVPLCSCPRAESSWETLLLAQRTGGETPGEGMWQEGGVCGFSWTLWRKVGKATLAPVAPMSAAFHQGPRPGQSCPTTDKALLARRSEALGL